MGLKTELNELLEKYQDIHISTIGKSESVASSYGEYFIISEIQGVLNKKHDPLKSSIRVAAFHLASKIQNREKLKRLLIKKDQLEKELSTTNDSIKQCTVIPNPLCSQLMHKKAADLEQKLTNKQSTH